MATERIKNRYVETLGIVIMLLALVRCAFPRVAGEHSPEAPGEPPLPTDTIASHAPAHPYTYNTEVPAYLPDGARPHRVYSVSSYAKCFPDVNSEQLQAAQRWGVKPAKSREDAEARKSELVYIGSSPYYHLDPLQRSIPYLVPRAAILLEDMARAYMDSLQVKGIPLHRFIVTSVMRTHDDVRKLQGHNQNATQHSCHLYGTTFDIAYNRYETVQQPGGPARRAVRDDTLKFVLSEMLRDMRQQQRCYVKYEMRQGCYHITVR